MKEALVEIGGVPLLIRLDHDSFRLEEAYLPFVLPSADPWGSWRVHKEAIPSAFRYPEQIGRSPRRWEVKRREGKREFRLWNSSQQGYLWKAALMELDCSGGDVWLEFNGGEVNCIPLFFLDLLLWSHLLLSHQGIILHATALSKNGETYLFPGPAGCGKSTWAELVSSSSDFEILGEDKVIIRKYRGGYQVFGTPWNPRPEYRSTGHGRLKGVFFLQPDQRNKVTELSPPEVLQQFIQTSFLPFSDREDLADSLSLLEDLVGEIPARRFGFKPDKSALDFFSSLSFL